MFREWDADCYKCGMDVELSIEGWGLMGGGSVPSFAVGGWDLISAPIPPSSLMLLSGLAMLRARRHVVAIAPR